MNLHRITFTHYGPKSSETGIHGYVITDDEALIPESVGSFADQMQDWGDDDGTGAAWPGEEWWEENPDAAERAEAMGLTVHVGGEWSDREGLPEHVTGPKAALLLWYRGDFGEISDTYYGVTHYAWDAGRPITEDETATLIKLGIAEVLS